MRPLKRTEKAFLQKVRAMRNSGLKWPEIADRIGEKQCVVYSRFQRFELREFRSAANAPAETNSPQAAG